MSDTTSRFDWRSCRNVRIPAKATVISLATVAGIDEKDPTKLGMGGCLTDRNYDPSKAKSAREKKMFEQILSQRCPKGRVTVDVTTPGEVFLILDSQSAVKWILNATAGTRIVGALSITDYKIVVEGLPDGVGFQQIEPKLNRRSKCNRLKPVSAYLGGRAAELLDEVVFGLSGRRIDRYMRKPYAGLSGRRIKPDDLENYSRFVVE